MSMLLRRALPFALIVLFSACAKKQDASLPLAFVPADTPYVFANVEPMPQAVVDEYADMMKQMWPSMFGTYSRLLDEAKDLTDEQRKVARAILDEVKALAEKGSGADAGFTSAAHFATYGVGLIPVVRWELADPQKLRDTVARVEGKAGAKLAIGKVGEQEYWHIGSDKVAVIIAIVDKHLVATIAPTKASDDAKKRLLGLVRPDQNLGDSGALAKLNTDNKFTPYGTGLIDTVRIVDIATGDTDALLREFKALDGKAPEPVDATCRQEFLDIAKKFPRAVLGYTALETKKMDMVGRFELEPTLAKDLAAAVGAAPGTGGAAEGQMDFALSLPVLKLKDFFIKQSKAVVDKPYACTHLADLNQGFAELNQKLATTIPPPASDLTGLRMTLTKLTLDNGAGKPDFAGKTLVALTNPMSALAMGQLVSPQLKDLKIAPDGKPVALPADLVPAQVPPLFAAMNDKAIAISVGAGEDAALGTYLAAPPAAEPVFFRMYFTGALYGQLGEWTKTFAAMLPEAQRKDIDDQRAMFALYQKWIRGADIKLTAKPNGIELFERIEWN
ncbi:MAG TPA: hypothetical protein VM555_00100 [Tahibacter sp.]|nr:hypothetical protein [Tahibacter sp.]